MQYFISCGPRNYGPFDTFAKGQEWLYKHAPHVRQRLNDVDRCDEGIGKGTHTFHYINDPNPAISSRYKELTND